jgi:serine protease Do
VLGVLVPLSPQSAEEVAGVEWYDSGIGFAIPLEAIDKALPRLRKGEDLYTGIMGIYLKSRNLYTGDTQLAACRPNSPADKAGIKAGDRIVEIDGRRVERAAEVRQEIARHDAGEKIRVVAMRDKERIEREVELVAKLQPYQHGFLGILPERGDSEHPLGVRYVYPDSPAAGAKIEPGDTIVSLGGKAIDNRDAMLREIASLEPGMEAKIEVRHGDKTRKLSVKLAALPEGLPPDKLPPAHASQKPGEGDGPKVGLITLRVPEFKNEAWAYVPEGYSPDEPCGIVVWLHGEKAPDQKSLLAQWKPWCDAHDLVLVVPKAGGASGWQVEEAGYLEKLLRQVENGYTIDATRVVVFGREAGASMAYLAAFRNRAMIRAAVVIDAGSVLPPPEAEPEHRLAVYVAFAKESRQAAFIGMSVAKLRETKIPVTLKDLGREPRDLKPDEMEELVRWVDMLDRI